MNIFIVYVKFLSWIVFIWVRLVRLIGENVAYGFRRAPNYKNKIYNNYKKKKKIGPIGVRAPLSPHLGLSLLKKKYKVDRSLEKI